MIRVLLCDPSEATRPGLRARLEESAELELCGVARSLAQAASLVTSPAPDVVLLDAELPPLGGSRAVRTLRALAPRARIVALGRPGEDEGSEDLLGAGADDYCIPDAPLWELERTLTGSGEPLARFARGLVRCAGSRHLGEVTARGLAALTGAELAVVYLAGPDAELTPAGLGGRAAPLAPTELPLVVARACAEPSLVYADGEELEELAPAVAGCREALAVPFVADGALLGALLVAMSPARDLRADPATVTAVADLAAAALARERWAEATLAEARRDALTGLHNRRAFDEQLERAARHARARAAPLSVVLLDLDGLKSVNDLEGHAAGDAVLQGVARALLRGVRADEEVYRIGGDEFAVVVAGDSRAAALVATRLQAELRRRRRGSRLPTLSGGVASMPEHAGATKELLERADATLYEAKRAGGNRVLVHGVEPASAVPAPRSASVARVLLVDDDHGMRMLLRTTFEVAGVEIDEATDAFDASARIAERLPDVVLLDIGLPGPDGFEYCRRLKQDPGTRDVGVVLLTGDDSASEAAAKAAGADALLRKPFSPLEVLAVVERLAGGSYAGPFRVAGSVPAHDQLMLYAQDLRRVLDVERTQRRHLQNASRATVRALASALDSKDFGTGAHSERVRRYAIELAHVVDPILVEDSSVEYGFLLHDIGKIGIPDRILLKRGPLSESDWHVMKTHTRLGEEMLGDVPLLQGEGLRIVRSHHERWDGSGYPDGLAGTSIPLSARIFAVADALDAMTSDRPYRAGRGWDEAAEEILRESSRHFDPDVVAAFEVCEPILHRTHGALAVA